MWRVHALEINGDLSTSPDCLYLSKRKVDSKEFNSLMEYLKKPAESEDQLVVATQLNLKEQRKPGRRLQVMQNYENST